MISFFYRLYINGRARKHVFHVIVQGMYVEIMHRALKTHLIGNLSEQIVIFLFIVSQLVSFMSICWFL